MAAAHQQEAEISQNGRADEALARTVRLLESSLESQQGTILFSIDTEYRYLYFNTAHAAAMRAAYGAEPEAGMNILELISSPEDRVSAKENYDRALAGESHSNVSVFGDVEKAYYESFFNPILDDDGTVIGATGMARDISERMRAEEALRESRDMIMNLTDQVPGVVYQYRLNPDGSSTFPFSSSGMHDSFEYSPEEVRDDAAPVFGRIHPDDYDRVAADIAESADTLEPFRCEFRVVLPRQGLRWRLSDAIPQRTDDGGTMWYGITTDVTERVMAEQRSALEQEQLAAHAARLKVIADASQAFAEVVDSAAMLDRVASKVAELVGGTCWVRLLSDDEEWLDVAVLRDTDPATQADAYAILTQQPQPVNDSGVASKVFLSGNPILIPVITADQLRGMSPQRLWPLFERFAMHSVAVAALRVHGKSIGVMGVTRSKADQPAFTGQDLDLLQDLATRVAMAISSAQLLEHQERHLQMIAGSLSSMIEVVSRVVEARDPYTVGHERRVSELAVRIAIEMGMTSEQIEDIRIASLVHDVGKVSVPTEILSKPGKLTDIEFSLIKGHSETGFEILFSANMEHEIAEMVHQHHERCDGSGYPRGLCADELLDGAKVLAVADVVEAMVSHRPYRERLGVDAALAEIERGAGLQYDVNVSEACVRLFREKDFEFTAA